MLASNDDSFEDQRINDEYKIWKKNCPFLYDLLITHSLQWPSLTCQWFPEVTTTEDAKNHRILLGTHSPTEQNYLLFVRVKFPNESHKEIDEKDRQNIEFGAFTPIHDKIVIEKKVNHDGEVNRARYMPQKTDIVATKAISGDVLIFASKERPDFPADNTCRPDLCLKGHSKEGFGLCWSPQKPGLLISGGDDGLVCLWDIQQGGDNVGTLNPLSTFTGHSSVVGDVAFHPKNDSVFASVSDDLNLMIWDTRAKDTSKPCHSVVCHSRGVNSVAYCPSFDSLLATCASDGLVTIWDTRNIKNRLHNLEGHNGEVYQVCWSPNHETILASGGSDRRILLWDLNKIGEEISTQDTEDGPSELMFMHAGHTSKVSDLSWNLNESWVIGSVAEDNIFQIWQIAENVLFDDDAAMLVDED